MGKFLFCPLEYGLCHYHKVRKNLGNFLSSFLKLELLHNFTKGLFGIFLCICKENPNDTTPKD